jgi:hypothetical protein
MNEHAVGMVTAICLTILVILCAGEPDILDGLIKRANTMEQCK